MTRGPIAVTTDFLGGSLAKVQVDGVTVVADLRREALVEADGFRYDYNAHFAFGISSLSPSPVLVDVWINCSPGDTLPGVEPLLFWSSALDRDFQRAPIDGRTDTHARYWFRVPIASRETVYLANYLFRPLPVLTAALDRLARDGGATREVFGRSVDGRDLVGYSWHEGTRPWVLLTSGFHPPEGDTLGTEALLEFLSSAAGRDLRERYNWYVVPIANPDGFARGYNACNTHEINFYWLFSEDERERCPEAYFLGQLARRLSPVLYVDFHSYTFQGHRKFAGPYLKPPLLYRGRRVRRAVRAIDAELIRVSDGHATRGVLTYTPSTLPSMLTRRFNTITYAKYHLRLADGVDRNKERAVAVVVAAARGIAERFPRPEALMLRPHGETGWDPISALARRWIEFWGLTLRPQLSRIKAALRR